ncbi:Cof-type HAD-IIB family hydrolase [Bacillus daqingensis]|uniref:Cof-type HAD-IIB family hydrolase n=1 Tax=Bacillus daqingensis TaxID=872396 RepID=A0ABV9NV72_9BACI
MRLLAVDMDGTLLNEDKTISKENIEAFHEAEEAGLEVAIATGRAFYDVFSILERYTINPWVINMNGACIHRPDGTMFDDLPLHGHSASPVLSWLEEQQYYYEISAHDAIYVPEGAEDRIKAEWELLPPGPEKEQIMQKMLHAQESQQGRRYIRSFEEALERDITIYNILALSLIPERVKAGWDKFSHLQEVSVVSSAPINFELTSPAASKGNALEKLAAYKHIPVEETAAVGDSFNDVSMLKQAGRGFAMGNAPDSIKQIAASTTKSNTEHGVAEVIYELLKAKTP